MHKIFISYSRKDYSSVVKLKDEIDLLLGKGVCWMDLTGIESDSQFVEVIINAINNSDIFLFMHSKSSEQSDWTRKEVMYANDKGKRLVFVKIDSTPLSDYFAFQFAGHDIINLNDKKQKQKLLKNLVGWCEPKVQFNSRSNQTIRGSQKKTSVRAIERVNSFLHIFLGDLGINELLNNLRQVVNKKSIVKAFVSLIVAIFFVLSGSYILKIMAVFLVYYGYRDIIHERFPKCDEYLQWVRHNCMRMLLILNTILSVFFLSIACTGYDSDFHFTSWEMLILSIILVVFVCVNWLKLKNMGKKEKLFCLIFPICLYITTVVIFQVRKYGIESYSDKINQIGEKIETLQTDTVKKENTDIKSISEEIEAIELEYPDTVYPMNYFEGVIDNSKSRLWTSEISSESETDTIYAYLLPYNKAYGNGFGFALIREKRIIRGIVETHDNSKYVSTTGSFIKKCTGEKKIGYVEGIFNIIENKAEIKGIIQTDSLINGKYEHVFSFEGFINNRHF